MMKRFLIVCAALASFAAPAAAQDAFVPGRPGATESAISAPEGRWQVESELASFARDSESGETAKSWSALATTFRYGIAYGMDAEVIVQPYVRSEYENGGVDERADGVGDITLRLRKTVSGQDGEGPSFGVIGFLTLPTASGDLGVEEAEAGVIATGGADISESLSYTLTAGVAAVHDGEDYDGQIFGGANLGFAINNRISAYVELFAERAAGDDETAATFDIGATYLLNEFTQLDIGANFGITDAADDVAIFVGWAKLF